MSDWAGGIRHKGTKEQIKIPYTVTLLLFWSTKNDTPYAKYNTIYMIYIYLHICTCLFISAWCMGYCNDTYLQTIFSGRTREKNDTKTISERYPKTQFESLGQEVTHPPTHLNNALTHEVPWCNVFPFHISWVEAIAWKEEKKNQTKEPNKATSFQHHHGNVHLQMQIRWIDQIQYPISLVTSLDTIPVICWNSTSFISIGKVHTHTHKQTNKQTQSFFLTVFAREKAFQ